MRRAPLGGELNRFRGVFLAAMDAEEAQIEASFGEAIRIAREQKSISLVTRALESYEAYRRGIRFHREAVRDIRLGL